MAPSKRLRKASDKSTEATTVTKAAATKKRSREVEESSNALQTTNLGYSSVKYVEASAHLAEGCPLVIYGIYPPHFEASTIWRGALLLYMDTRPPCAGKRWRDASCYIRILALVISRIPSANCAGIASRRVFDYYDMFLSVFHELFRGCNGYCSSHSHIQPQLALKVIYNKLKGINQFEASIFSDFTMMKTTQFCGGFVHHLLLKQLYNDDPHVIEFEFNRVGARFDRKAFVMFTWLNYGKFPKETEMMNLFYSLWTKYFGESSPMAQTEFGLAFKDIEFKYDNDQEIWDNVKSHVLSRTASPTVD
ncbi:hypothetical protein FNV43_RR19991 [Rhamnella rubrinervis]|uniref:Uncharacterized protein n=1 Tax=Rhamnella rubrinervis TaxID=2594499 RepID=A0A8K0DZI6_9ROSA|nr:hypothetical protein FNV43_RR19991 [Rhamnella rubrinervis]